MRALEHVQPHGVVVPVVHDARAHFGRVALPAARQERIQHAADCSNHGRARSLHLSTDPWVTNGAKGLAMTDTERCTVVPAAQRTALHCASRFKHCTRATAGRTDGARRGGTSRTASTCARMSSGRTRPRKVSLSRNRRRTTSTPPVYAQHCSLTATVASA